MASNPPPTPGLTSAEVAERIKRGESNNFKARVGRTYLQILLDNLFNLFNLVLFTLLLVVLLLQDYATVLFAGFSVVTNSILGMFQEINAKRKLDQLAALAVQDIPVWRDGRLTPVPIAQIVKDDVIPIQPGDRLVVDGRVLHSEALEIDESQLTGESDAVFKDEGSELYSGSFCVAGIGLMAATRVGRHSTINQLSVIAKVYKNVKTPTQQRIAALVEITVLIMLIIVPMLFLANWLTSQTLLDTFRSQVVFVSSIVPQGLVLTATLSLTLGALSISRFRTLIQRVNAVESMANVTVLCFDKTGTLTRNQLAVSDLIPLGRITPEDLRARLLRYTRSLAHQNRTAAAVAEYAEQVAPSANGQYAPAKVREIPFNSSRKWGAIVFADETLLLGAPERILSQNTAYDEYVIERASELSRRGLRVLAFARLDQPPADGQLNGGCEPLGLIVLSDQIRPDIQETLDAFRAQNVELKIISGDNLETVTAIATQAGMDVHKPMTGDQLEAFSDHELEAVVTESNLFARVEPDTKRRIIAALKREGAYVAMVGDGVNDVPALKEAHLAVVMNDGAQISKDVGDIVLLNNAMSTLPKAFAEGREITQTIYGTTKLFLAKNFYNIALIFFIGFMTLPFPTTPIQISWITFGTVNIPATLIAFKLIRPAYMQRFRRDVLDYVVLSGMVGAVNLAVLYTLVYFASERNFYAARSAVTVFIALYGTLIFWNTHDVHLLRFSTMRRQWPIVALGIGLLVLTVLVPFILPEPFNFVAPTPMIWLLITTMFLLTAVTLDVVVRNRHLINQVWKLVEP